MRLYFRWKLFFGFFGFAVGVAALLVAWLLLEVSRGHLFGGESEPVGELGQWLLHFLSWALLVLALVSIPPALWIASRLNRPIRLLDRAMKEASRGNLECPVPPLRTYDEFENLIGHFNLMLAGLRELGSLRAERDRFLAHSLDLIGLAGTDGYFKEVNPAFQRVLGHSADLMLSKPFLEFVHPDDVPATVGEFEKLIQGIPTLSFVNRYRCADGSYRWLEWSAAPVPQQRLVFAIARDITDRKRMEQAEESLIESRLQLRIARDIQRSLLPAAAPVLDGFDIAGASRPAEEVGGDYFDYLPMCHGRLGLVVSDVAGHGIGAGLVMAATRSMLRALAMADCDLEVILERTNRMLHESTPDNCFVTLALSQLDPAERRLRWVSCGHPASYLLDRTGLTKARLDATAPPLGFLEDFAAGPVLELALEPGDVLVMLTDGVLEAESPQQQMFGDQRALEVVRAHLHLSAAGIVDALHEAAREFCQARETKDDATSLVVKVGQCS